MSPAWFKKKGIIHDLFGSVFWPGAAGSILWSAGSIIDRVAEAPDETAHSTLVGALLLLLALSAYSILSWIQTRTRDFELDGRFVIFETLNLVLVALCAISVQTTFTESTKETNIVNPTNIFFIAYFVVSTIGHLFGAWEPPEKKKARYALAAANFLGIVVVIFLAFIGVSTVWGSVSAFVVVIWLWWRIARGAEILDAVIAFYD